MESADHSTYPTFYFHGEPYLDPSFLEMVKIAKRTIKSRLYRLISSIDSAKQKTYASTKKTVKLDKVWAERKPFKATEKS